MIRGEPEAPSSFHQPEGAGCCTPGGNSAQLLKKIATAVRGRSLTSWIDFIKRRKYAAATITLVLLPLYIPIQKLGEPSRACGKSCGTGGLGFNQGVADEG
jgi:hypothetical protein